MTPAYKGWKRESKNVALYKTEYRHYEDSFKKSDNYHTVTSSVFALSNGNSDWVVLEYPIRDVPGGNPLFAYVKVGFPSTNGQSVHVKMELLERRQVRNGCKKHGNTYDCRGKIVTDSLLSKNVELSNAERWHNIVSDYPVYKQHALSLLILRISALNPLGSDVFFYHAQVGSEKETLALAEPSEKGAIHP